MNYRKTKHLWSLMLILAMAVAMLIGMAVTVNATTGTPVPYMDWDAEQNKLVEKTGDYACKDYTVVTSDVSEWGETGKETWYVVNSDVEFDEKRIDFAGNVHLILCDNKTLTAKKGIYNASGGSLTVYVQSTGDKMGKLNATGTGGGAVGSICIGNDLTINGGAVSVNNGSIAISSQHDITINGGKVTAEGRETGDGGIYAYRAVTINGGDITASGKFYGINALNGDVTINDGSVDASSLTDFAAFGGIRSGNGNVTINGGEVQAIANTAGDDNNSVGVSLGNAEKTVTIGENVGFFFAVGPKGAFKNSTIVKNGIAGTGWENADGTGTTASIPTSTEGQTLNYKRVQFPASDDVQRVVDMITALPDPAKVTANDEKAIREARKAYDNLSEPQKQNRRLTQAIKNKLSNCEAALAKAVDQQAASKVSGQIAAIPGDPSQATSAQVATAAAAYKKLTPSQKKLISGSELAKLQTALNYPATMLKVKLKSAKAKKGKKALVKWTKNPTANGYQLYYAAKGVKAKEVDIYDANTLKKTVKKLKAKKKYTFRIRTFTNMEDLATPGASIRVYGQWSNAKKVKAKK
ncbi:MAG: hypothetical protein IJI20_05850 [Firmicutes bacterium]|nr:hypothetical protein [Bacillota bacterium]